MSKKCSGNDALMGLCNNNEIAYNSGNSSENIADIIGSIFGTGGIGGAASGAGQIICAIKGTCPPNTVVYQTGNTGTGGAMAGLLLPIIILVGILALFYFLAKKK